jgi:hypothetical protein
MNIVLYAGDKKYHSVLEPIAEELKNTNHTFLYTFTNSTQLLFPTQNPEQFFHDGQISESTTHVDCETLGVRIPFKPDVLILARERWQPEQSIIHEFKAKWGCKICCVEVSSHLANNIENRLEMLSRTNYPQNKIDYFFEHSEWAKQRRIDCLDNSFKSKTIVVGNTRKFTSNSINEAIKTKYSIDPSKEQILFWGVINTTRPTALKALKVLAEKTKNTHQIFYKCYPGEPHNELFKSQFNPFCVEGVQVIYDENDIYDMAQICDTHIAAASSVFNFAFINNKKLINLDSVCNASEKMNDFATFISEKNNGVEDSAQFWMRIWDLNNYREFKDLVGEDRVQLFKTTNKEFLSQVKQHTIDFDWDCQFLDTPKKEYGSLIEIFDQYKFDGNAPSRIINFLTNE